MVLLDDPSQTQLLQHALLLVAPASTTTVAAATALASATGLGGNGSRHGRGLPGTFEFAFCHLDRTPKMADDDATTRADVDDVLGALVSQPPPRALSALLASPLPSHYPCSLAWSPLPGLLSLGFALMIAKTER